MWLGETSHVQPQRIVLLLPLEVLPSSVDVWNTAEFFRKVPPIGHEIDAALVRYAADVAYGAVETKLYLLFLKRRNSGLALHLFVI